MRQYTFEKYKKLVEDINLADFQLYQKAEEEVIFKVKNAKRKTFIDLGAGYGRVVPLLARTARNIIAIEINPGMFLELKRRAKKYRNVRAIKADMQKLSALLEKEDVKNPVLLLLQNTLGTIEGDYKKVLSQMKLVAKKYQGEIILSLLRAEALQGFGMKFYTKLQEMVGEPDLQKTDFGEGLFVSKTGYISKWWTDDELQKIKKYFGEKILNEVKTDIFYIVHIAPW